MDKVRLNRMLGKTALQLEIAIAALETVAYGSHLNTLQKSDRAKMAIEQIEKLNDDNKKPGEGGHCDENS